VPLDHYISQVHLKNFYSPELGERMYAIRKSDLKKFTPNAQSVCRIEEGNTNAYLREDRIVEEILRSIEPRYNASVAKLISDNIDSECIYTIAGFTAYVITCSPTGMRVHSDHMRSMVETAAVAADARGLLPPPPEKLGGARLAELLRDGHIQITVDPKYPQAMGITTILKDIAVFGNSRWDILLNDFDESPFFTSDFPVAIEKTRDWRVLNRIVPLAPNLAARIKPDLNMDRKRADFSFTNFDRRIRHVSLQEIAKINELIVRCAEDSVFYRDDLAWVEKFIAKNRCYRIEPITNKIPQGNGTLVISSQRILPWRADRVDQEHVI
jgi:hypothetical protein